MLGLAVVLFAVFAATIGYVVAGDATARIDRPVYDWVLTWRNEPLTTAATVTTQIGGSVVMWALALSACALLAKRGAQADLLLVAGVGVASAVLVPVAKQVIDRPRPAVADHLVEVSSPAFPSGHSAGSAAVVGVLATVFCMRTTHRVVGVLVASFGVAFVVLVGLSRVYLGVHWPTDVLAGWTLGGLLVVVGVLMRTRVADPDLSAPIGPAAGSGPEADDAWSARY